MAKLPSTGAFDHLGATRPNSAMPAPHEAQRAVIGQLPGGARRGASVLLPSASGVVAPVRASVVLDWAVSASSGTLTGIDASGLPDGAVIRLRLADPAHPVTVKHAAAGIPAAQKLALADGQDLQLVSTAQRLWLEETGSGLEETDRAWGPGTGAAGNAALAYLGIGTSGSWPKATTTEIRAAVSNRGVDPALLKFALDDPYWVAALPVATTVNPGNVVVVYDGSQLWRAALATTLLGAPSAPYVVEEALSLGDFSEHAHGLGRAPVLHQAKLLCVTADLGYAVGQEIGSPDLQSYADGTLVGWSSNGAVAIPNGSGGFPNVTPARWHVVTRAYK